MKIALDIVPNPWLEPFLTHIHTLDLPIVHKNQADIVIKQAELISEKDLTEGYPIIALENSDCARISFRHKLKHRSVIRYVKQYDFTQHALHNKVDERLFITHLAKSHGITEPEVKITKDDHQKIVCGWNFLHTRHMGVFIKRDPKSLQYTERELDSFFSGRLDYNLERNSIIGSIISAHRVECARILESLNDLEIAVVRGNRLRKKIYTQALYQSKVIVSPYGWGEACYRDYEAILAGCSLIKPDASYVRSSCNIFDGSYCTWTEPDLSDLEEKVRAELDCWHVKKEERHYNRSKLIFEHNRTPDIVRSIFEGL
jgi:hypothetical protein